MTYPKLGEQWQEAAKQTVITSYSIHYTKLYESDAVPHHNRVFVCLHRNLVKNIGMISYNFV